MTLRPLCPGTVAAAAVLLLTCAASPFAQTYTPPRTPWGHPDLQGVWTSDDARGVPAQRPAEFGERRLLTDEEFAARVQRDQETWADVGVAAGTFVGEVGTRSLRETSLVVSPPDGRYPARTAAADARMASLAEASNPLLPASWEDRSLFERCISRGPLASMPTLYGNGLQIVQSPTTVAISHEMIHEARLIPIGPSAVASGALRSYMGYSTGRWEGDTLVVNTSGFTGQTTAGGTRHTADLRIVERLTRVSADTVMYEATVSDPGTWVGPWTVRVPLSTQPGYRVYAYDCHEGNNALRNMLSAAREEERVRDDYIRKGLEPPPLRRPNDGDILPRDPSFGRPR